MPVVGFLLITLSLEGNSSLKDKRKVVKSILARVRAKFNASCSEVDSQDDYEEARLGFSVCGPEARILRTVLNRILEFVDQNAKAEVADFEIHCPIVPDEDSEDNYDGEDDDEDEQLRAISRLSGPDLGITVLSIVTPGEPTEPVYIDLPEEDPGPKHLDSDFWAAFEGDGEGEPGGASKGPFRQRPPKGPKESRPLPKVLRFWPGGRPQGDEE